MPSAVICGVTSSFRTASTYCTAMVLLMLVWIGILLTLLDGQLLVILSDALRFGQNFADAAAFHQAQHEVDGIVVALRGES